MTSISLLSCLVICSSGWLSASATIVMRERSGFSVGPTARDSMLNPRRLNSAETRASTPDLFSTRTESVWRVIAWLDLSDRLAPGRPPLRGPPRAKRVVGGEGVLYLPLPEDGPHVARGEDVVVAGPGGDHGPHL